MEETTLYIDKQRKLHDSENFAFLRAKGLEYIEELANKIWTDYNIHDPGITNLEALCYAITDLGYRTNYLIKDILAEGTPAGKKPEKQFYSAREILTCNPVTINDYRKILIDVDGVRNAWIEIEKNPSPQIFINCPNSQLTFNPNLKTKKHVNLRGLYNIILELDDDELGDLNVYYYERTVNTKNGSLVFQISLPGWDVFYKEKSIPSKIEFTSIGSSDQPLTYSGILTAEYSTGAKFFNFTITLKDLKSETNKNLIEKELFRKDKNSLARRYLNMLTKALSIVKKAENTLQAKRNLCEDFYSFKAIDIEDVIICADIEVTSIADVSEVLAQIYYKIENFISPEVRFYTVKEMYGKGKKTEEIFEGPVLNYGFIDEDELKKSELKNVIHVSDIIQIIMDVPEVVAVKNIVLSNLYKGILLNESEKWCLNITKGRMPRFLTDKSQIFLYKGFIPVAAEETETSANLKELQLADRPKRLSKEEYDLKIPTGSNKEIRNYYSIQNDYPLCYGIGKEGLPLSAGAKRKAQAKQLKGYLLFFDKMLADYFAQLGYVKDLFSTNPKVQRTYFSHNLLKDEENNVTDIPNAQNLFKEFIDYLDLTKNDFDLDDYTSLEEEWNKFIALEKNTPFVYKREDLYETIEVYENRRNRFLDHLMARFAEQFSDYVALMFTMDRMKAPSELIEDKISFLDSYADISSNRGKAFNYKDSGNLWNTENVSGLEKRVSRLLGINSFQRKNLARFIESTFEFYQEKDADGIDEYRFRMIDNEGNILISSTTKYYNMDDAYKEKNTVLKYGLYKENYVIKRTKKGTYHIVLTDDSDEPIARVIKYFKKLELAQAAVEKIISFMEKGSLECEGFHLIEHILLRPCAVDDKLLTVCVNKDCKNCSGFIDPYSCRVTVIVPYWPRRFRNMDFRRHFEATLRMEVPAHIHAKICWVDEKAMENFEEKYSAWLIESAKEQPDQKILSGSLKELIETLEKLRSIYPETRLFDYESEDYSNAAVLNHSILGSTKEEENGNM